MYIHRFCFGDTAVNVGEVLLCGLLVARKNVTDIVEPHSGLIANESEIVPGEEISNA